MNPLRYNLFCFDESAAGTGTAGGGAAPSAAPAAGSPPASSSSDGGGSSPGSSGASGDAGGSASPPSDSLAGFDDFGDDLDSIDLGDVSTDDGSGATPPTLAAPVAQAEPPAATPAPGTPPATPPAAAAPAAPVQNEPSAPRSALEQALEGFTSNQAALVDWSAQNLFALSKEEAEALETDAVAAVPKLMGRAYTEALKAATNLIRNFVPNMVQEEVQAHTSTAARSQEALNQFYSANPHLNAKDHGAAVTKWAKSFRQANPKASRADAIAYVGRAVSFEFGINPGAPAAPAAKVPPFAPAHSGARAPAPARSSSPFDGMEDDFD